MPEIKLPYPHPGQQYVIKHAKRFNWLSAGRRWRKTTLLMQLVIPALLSGKRILWAAPTYNQVRIGWGECRYATRGVVVYNSGRMEAVFEKTGGIIYFRSLDNPDNARGLTVDLALFDEIGYINPDAYYNVVRQMLLDTGGDFWGVGTPNGQNWFWLEHRRALDRDDSACWQIPSLGCEIVNGQIVRKPHPLENPFLSFDELQSIFITTPINVFRQEIMAEFIKGEGQVFRRIQENLSTVEHNPDDHADHYVVAGIDWGKQNDFTAISIGCRDCRCEIYHDRFNQIDWAFQYARLEDKLKTWRVKYALVERNSIGDPGFEALQRSGLPVAGFDTTASSKPQLIENLALTIERCEIRFINDPVWTAELEAYERQVSSVTGRSSYSAPDGMHDDTVIARALMVWAATNSVWYMS